VQHRVAACRYLARVEHPPGADAPTIAGLAAAERIKDGAVELDRVVVHRDYGGVADPEIRIVAEQQFGHQCISTTSATIKMTSELAAKKMRVVRETSGSAGSRGIGLPCSSCSFSFGGGASTTVVPSSPPPQPCARPTLALKLRKKSSARF